MYVVPETSIVTKQLKGGSEEERAAVSAWTIEMEGK